MFSRKFRIRFFTKMAQTVPEPTVEDQAVSEDINNLPPLPTFSATGRYPTLNTAFPGAGNIIDELSMMVHKALFYTSAGEYNLNDLCSNNFSTTISGTSDKNVIALFNFAKSMFLSIFNGGKPYPDRSLTKEEFNEKIDNLLVGSTLDNLSTTNIKGPLAEKIGPDVKNSLKNMLQNLKNKAPSE